MPEDQIYDRVIVDTRPVIELDGEQYPQVPELLLSVEMREQVGGLSQCEILLENMTDHEGVGLDFAFEHAETNHFAPGTLLRLLTGDAASPTELFRGRISAVGLELREGGVPMLRVLAEDALMAWRMIRRNRSFAAGPLRDMLDRMARDNGLTAVITGLEDEVDDQQQLNETDLGFLRRLLERYDADAQIVGEELHISPRAQVERGTATLELGRQLRAIRVVADLAQQRAVTQVHGFDVLAATVESITARENQLGPGTGQTGTELVAQVFPHSRDRLTDTTFAERDEGQTLADAAHRRRARRFVVAEGEATGNAAIRVGTVLTLSGLGPRFSNDFYTVEACHRFDRTSGYVTDFTAECAFLGRV